MGRSIAFKCTYNDGGKGTHVGFSDTCSKDNIERNIKARVWCSNPGCPCFRYYENRMIGTKPHNPCYESTLFRDWQFGAGYSHKGPNAGKPVHLSEAEVGKFAFLTTRFPGGEEPDRRIIGLFKIGKIENKVETIVFAEQECRIRLPLEEANELYFWAYHNTRKGIPDWRTRLFRYLDDNQVLRILIDIAETVRDEHTKIILKNIISREFSNSAVPDPNGCLPEKSTNRVREIIRKRKYGSGGEGPEHYKLKMYLSKHPHKIGITNTVNVDVEHNFLCGDSVDLVFSHKNGNFTVVEVETIDPLPGAHQAIKYRALTCAERGFPLDSNKVKAALVAWNRPNTVKSFCKKYGIDFHKFKL